MFRSYSIDVSSRHLRLIADFLTFSGSVAAFNRHSMKNHPSPVQRASYETALTVLNEMMVHGTTRSFHWPRFHFSIQATSTISNLRRPTSCWDSRWPISARTLWRYWLIGEICNIVALRSCSCFVVLAVLVAGFRGGTGCDGVQDVFVCVGICVSLCVCMGHWTVKRCRSFSRSNHVGFNRYSKVHLYSNINEKPAWISKFDCKHL